MKHNTSITITIIIFVFACAVLTTIATPLIAPMIVENTTGIAVPGGIQDVISADNLVSYLLTYTTSMIQSEYLWVVAVVFCISAICLFLLSFCFRIRQPNRTVDDGVLGDAKLLNTASQRRKSNVFWNGKGKAPGASLVFGFERGKMIGDPDYAHGWVCAKSGSGKTRSVGYASLFWNIKAGASIIYTARKLTEYKLCYKAIEAEGIKTFLLDLEEPKRGSRINLMDTVNGYVSADDIAAAQRAARQLAKDFIKTDEKNPYFSNSARALMTASILLVAMSDDCEPEDKNLISVASIIRNGLTGCGKDPAAPLKDYIRCLGSEHPAYKAAADFLQDNGTTAGRNVASTLMTALTVLGDQGIEWMLSGSDFTLRQLAEEQCVLFPHCLGEEDPYNVILAALYNQLWETLQRVNNEHGERLPIPFVIIGDEWGNLPRVDCLGEMVALGRSMDLHVFIFVQNMAQLNKYNNSGDQGAGVDKLLGSMNLQIAMSVMKTDPDGKYFSDLCGYKTVLTSSNSQNRSAGTLGTSSSGQSLQEHQVELISASTFKDRVPLKDGIIVVKGGENGAPGHEGIFEMPLVDATKIKPVAQFFGLGTKEEDTHRCNRVEFILRSKGLQRDEHIAVWCPDFSTYESGSTHQNDIDQDELMVWDGM